uniref:Uncharacterized protein n=1 Tax=Coccidioides posadasii RMSCC 3488 TaxID=454284 RepID=A0A0J6F6K7_COCPO|nr:hypothetical protein CPAG_04902 [Coccidioides posadasii RMSCC 3488]
MTAGVAGNEGRESFNLSKVVGQRRRWRSRSGELRRQPCRMPDAQLKGCCTCGMVKGDGAVTTRTWMVAGDEAGGRGRRLDSGQGLSSAQQIPVKTSSVCCWRPFPHRAQIGGGAPKITPRAARAVGIPEAASCTVQVT